MTWTYHILKGKRLKEQNDWSRQNQNYAYCISCFDGTSHEKCIQNQISINEEKNWCIEEEIGHYYSIFVINLLHQIADDIVLIFACLNRFEI